jgi:protein-S-isoprenylcysteine O-methyltransferase Ste14
LKDLLAFITIIVWPVIPLFWIPVHAFRRISRKLGVLTYLIPLLLWLPAAYLIYVYKDFLLLYRIGLPDMVNISGRVLFIIGLGLQLWTVKLLGLPAIMGLPELTPRVKGRLVKEGAFSIVRHPTYLSHTIMFGGIFFLTEVISVGIVLVLDFILVHAVIIPLEDKELSERFGDEYREYKKKVPSFFP